MMRQMAQPFPVGMVAGQGADGVCVHSVQMTFNAGQAPHVVSQTSGHCGEGAPGAPAATPAVQPSVPNMKPSAPTIEVKDQHPVEAPSYRGLVPSPSEWRG
jgi:hypothetical protein